MLKPPLFGDCHGGIHRGMGRRVEEDELCGAKPQDVEHSGAHRIGFRQRGRDQCVDLAEPAQHGGDHQPDETAVARFQRVQPLMRVERIIERDLLPQHRFEQVEGGAARGEGGIGHAARFSARKGACRIGKAVTLQSARHHSHEDQAS